MREPVIGICLLTDHTKKPYFGPPCKRDGVLYNAIPRSEGRKPRLHKTKRGWQQNYQELASKGTGSKKFFWCGVDYLVLCSEHVAKVVK